MSDNGDAGGGDDYGGGGRDNFNDNDGVHHGHNGGRHDYNSGYHDDYNSGYHDDYSETERKPIPFACKVILLVFLMLLGFGVGGGVLANSITMNNNFESVTGTIIDRVSCGQSCSTSSSGNRSCSTTYAATIEYAVDGTTYQFTTSSCSNPGPTVGNDIKVLYDPSDPSDAADGSFLALWLLPIILLPLGLTGCLCLCGITFKKLSSASGTDTPVDNGFGPSPADENPFKPTVEEGPPPTSTYNTSPSAPTAPIAGTGEAQSSSVPESTYYSSSTTNPPPTHSGGKPQSQANAGPSLFDQMNAGV